jgi:hypothetical protein
MHTKHDEVFNINTLLKELFDDLKAEAEKQCIELIFDMDPTVPKLIRGDHQKLLETLSLFLKFVFQNSRSGELVFSIKAPEDFLYEEPIIFSIESIDLFTGQSWIILKSMLSAKVEALAGSIEQKESGAIEISIPFMVHELGFRRHYRLRDASLMKKNILLLCRSPKLSESIRKFFLYFHYAVTIEHQPVSELITSYDIIVAEKEVVDAQTAAVIKKAIAEGSKFVWLDTPSDEMADIAYDAILRKPVIQESVLKLIHGLYEEKKEEKAVQQEEESAENRELSIVDSQFVHDHPERLQTILSDLNETGQEFERLVAHKDMGGIEAFCFRVEKILDEIGADSMFIVLELIKTVIDNREYELLPKYVAYYKEELLKLQSVMKK